MSDFTFSVLNAKLDLINDKIEDLIKRIEQLKDAQNNLAYRTNVLESEIDGWKFLNDRNDSDFFK